jgi:uncharacterized protein
LIRHLTDAPLALHVDGLDRALRQNPVVVAILERAFRGSLPGWYLGAGEIAQTVWNQHHGFEPTRGVKDYDLVYFDTADLSAAAEQRAADRMRQLLADFDGKLDVTNEARDQWYPERFGRSIPAYTSTEHAISA